MASAGNTMTNNSILFNNYIEAVENHPELYSKPWIIEDNKGRTWFICGEANSANSSEVAVLKKNIYL